MVKLHKVEVFVVDIGDGIDVLEEFRYLCEAQDYNPLIAKVGDVETVSFEREWEDEDILNSKVNLDTPGFLDLAMKFDKKE